MAPTDRNREPGDATPSPVRSMPKILRLYESGLAERAVAEQLKLSKGCALKILKRGSDNATGGAIGSFTAIRPGSSRRVDHMPSF
jgi:hypothetical protein